MIISSITVTEKNIDECGDWVGPSGVTIREQWDHRFVETQAMMAFYILDGDTLMPKRRSRSLEEEFFGRVGFES